VSRLRQAFARAETQTAAALVVVFAIVIGEATRYPRDSRLFPMIVGAAGILMSLLLLVRLLRRPDPVGPVDATDEEAGEPAGHRTPLWIALAASPLFGLVMWLAGFWVATALTVFLGPWVMGYRNLRRRILLTVGTVLVLWLLFPVLLKVPLPAGEIADRFFYVDDDD